jgi:hypothetical protein
MDQTETAQALWSLINSHALARCVHVIAETAVSDALEDIPMPAAELARRCSLDADALHRMMRLLATQGVFALKEGLYSHTAASRLLRSDHPQSLRSFARMIGMPAVWNGFTQLEVVAHTGKPPLDMAGLVRYLSEHPSEASLFNQAMVAKSAAAIPVIVGSYDFSRCGVIADIGGGHGHLLHAILEHNPASSGILFELPHVIADVSGRASPRVRLVSGNFFSSDIPQADVYVLMEVIHDWADADAARILMAVRSGASRLSRLLIIESLIADTPGLHPGKLLDVIMLAVTGGRERTATECEELLRGAGFELARILPTASPYSIVEAVAS